MKLLITGGCGFLGSNLAADALKRGYELVLLDNLHREGSQTNLNWLRNQGEFKFTHSDIRNQYDVTKVIKDFKPDALFHLAGQVAMTTSISDPRLDFETNAIGSFNVLEAVRHYTPDCTVIYSSTNKVYGDLEQFTYRETETRYLNNEKPDGIDESTNLEFHSPYGCSKGAADQYFLDYARIYGLKTIVFRHSSMYGGHQFSTYDQGWVGWFCEQALLTQQNKLKEPFTISGNGKQVRDILHVDDVITLYQSAISHTEMISGEAFNIGGGHSNSLSLLELFSILNDLLDIDLHYTQLPPRESDQKVFIADISKAMKMLKWDVAVDARTGIHSLISSK